MLGTTGAFVLWTISVLLGALQNNVYAEMATMFPHKAGGISLYAHEAWRKYLSLIGPVATFGYWFAWSSVLAINGYVIGTLVQAEWFSDTTFTQDVGNFQWSLPVCIGIGCILAVWLFNIFGVRPAVWFSYVTGGAADPARGVLMFLPYLTGDWSSDNMTWEIGAGGGLGLAMTWLYFMCWSAYGFETVAAFAPEYHDPELDTPRALRASAAFSVVVYALLPLGVGGTLGTAAIADGRDAIAFYKDAFDVLVGNTLGQVMIVCLIAGLLLSMNTATMDGSRALYGIAQDGMTTKWLGRQEHERRRGQDQRGPGDVAQPHRRPDAVDVEEPDGDDAADADVDGQVPLEVAHVLGKRGVREPLGLHQRADDVAVDGEHARPGEPVAERRDRPDQRRGTSAKPRARTGRSAGRVREHRRHLGVDVVLERPEEDRDRPQDESAGGAESTDRAPSAAMRKPGFASATTKPSHHVIALRSCLSSTSACAISTPRS